MFLGNEIQSLGEKGSNRIDPLGDYIKNNIYYTEQLIPVKIQTRNIYVRMLHDNKGWALYILRAIPENAADLDIKNHCPQIICMQNFKECCLKSSVHHQHCFSVTLETLCQFQNSDREQMCFSF